jgi:hypothetical protein
MNSGVPFASVALAIVVTAQEDVVRLDVARPSSTLHVVRQESFVQLQ